MQIRFGGAISHVAPQRALSACGDTDGGAADSATAPYMVRSTVIAVQQEECAHGTRMIRDFNSGNRTYVPGIDLAFDDGRPRACHPAVARTGALVRHGVPLTDHNGVKRHIEFVDKGV